MPYPKFALTLLLISLLLTACNPSAPIPSPLSPASASTSTSTAVGAPLPTARPPRTATPPTLRPTLSAGSTRLTVLYTSDEHGWMAGEEDGQGAAELFGLWQVEHKLGQDPSVLVLSGGDNWTGPAISTWFDGQGMVEVMNAMGYSASAVGNHEFDFGLEVLQARLGEADFPFLSANLHQRSDGEIPIELGIRPYTILDVAGLSVGILGLSATYTPNVANPAYLAEFEFIDYQLTLRDYIPQMRAEGAEIILVIAHLCPDELELLALQVADLEIAMLGGGHCHIGYARQSGDTAIIASPGNLSGYAYVTLDVDPSSGQTRLVDLGVMPNQGGRADPAVAQIIAGWQAQADAELDVEIGYLAQTIPEDSQPMQDLITESWIWAYPNADVALTNLGGMRADLPAGMLTIAEVIGVLPFNNRIIEVHLTGAQVIETLTDGRDNLAIGGMHYTAGGWVVENSGESLDPQALYSVLVNDYMYAGGDGYTILAQADPDAYQTGIDWRQPVIDWILAQESSPEAPLDAAIAALGD